MTSLSIIEKLGSGDDLVKVIRMGHDETHRMLEHLFGSRTRVKLIGLFLRHPEEAIYVREITRRMDTQINAVRRELANLMRLGFLVESQMIESDPAAKKSPGLKKKYYRLNHQCLFIKEISALVMKAQLMLEKQLDQKILALGDIRLLAFLGMFVGQKAAPVDVFIVGDIDQKALKRLLADTEQELGRDINFSVMTIEEYKYRKDITDKFLYAILEAPKNVVLDRLHERMEGVSV